MKTERDFAPDPRDGRRRFMIAGEHVILRAFEREDAERCYRWMNDPNIVRTLKSRYPIAFQNEVEWLQSAMEASATERHFAIERKDDRSHIGNASIHDIDWVSRTHPYEPPAPAFRGMAASLLAASPGNLGGLRGLFAVRKILSVLGTLVLPTQF